MSDKKDFNKKYDKMINDLQVKLVHMQDWVIENNKKVVIVFEGRDAAGKGCLLYTSPSPRDRG